MLFEGALRRAALTALLKPFFGAKDSAKLARAANQWIEEVARMNGFKSYFGSLIKNAGWAAVAFAVNHVPQVQDALNQKGGGGVLAAVLIGLAGKTLQEWGMAHKAEKQIEATKENTAAVEVASTTAQPVTVVEEGKPVGPSAAQRSALLGRRP